MASLETELRIGNWIRFRNGAVQMRACHFFKLDEHISRADNLVTTMEYFGMTPIPTDKYWMKKIEWRGRLLQFFFRKKHVHQLQNLYHALTEKELFPTTK